MPIKILILSNHSTMRGILTSQLTGKSLQLGYSESNSFELIYVDTLSELLLQTKEHQPQLIMIDADPEKILNALHQYTPLLYPTSAPVIIIHEAIAKEVGEKLLAASFADYLSQHDLCGERLTRTLSLLIQLHKQTAEISDLQGCDLLTSLKNRASFYKVLQQRLDPIIKQGGALALITVDIDNFTAFNQRMGVAAGDQLLLDLRDRLLHCAQGFPVFRIGNDEFALIITAPSSDLVHADVQCILEKMAGSLFASFTVFEQENMLGISIGVTFAPEHGINIDSLTNQANQARKRAKRTHGCSFSIYEPAKDRAPPYAGLLESDIWTALKKEQFELYYQPRIDLRLGKIVGAEALMRWNHPKHGLMMPDDFIPIAEQTGQIVPMGFWAIYQSGRDLALIKNAGFKLLKVGVNLSFKQFQDDNLAQTIHRIIESEKIDTRILEFELTESALCSDDLHVQHSIEALSKMGIDFSLDDFGTGYSSFALLQKFPINALKIDRSFVAQLPESSGDSEIVRAIIHLAHNLNMGVIAEGVETKQQLEFLLENGCDQAQGFLFSPPLPLTDFMNMLEAD